MKKVLVLLLAFSCSALYGVCACQRPKPQPQPQPAQQPQQAPNTKDKQTPDQIKKQKIAPETQAKN